MSKSYHLFYNHNGCHIPHEYMKENAWQMEDVIVERGRAHYSAKKRLKIYTDARWMYLHMGYPYEGMCRFLADEVLEPDYRQKGNWEQKLLGLLYELNEIRPKKAQFGWFWWPLSDFKPRLRAFDQMIELAKEEIVNDKIFLDELRKKTPNGQEKSL